MKFFLVTFAIISILALSQISIHAYEGTYVLECETVEENMEGLIEEVYALPVTLSSHQGAANGISGARTGAVALMNRRDLQVPLWAAAQ